MIKTAFSTLSCPDWSWHDLLEHGPKAGYDGVEIRLLERETDLLVRPEFQSSHLPARRHELDDSGFQVCGLASSVRFDGPSDSVRDEQVRVGRRYVDLAHELGAGFVRVFGDVLPEGDDETERSSAMERIAGGLDQLGEHAGDAGVGVLLETHGDFCDSRNLCELMERVTSPAVGVLWDTHHPWRFHEEEVSASWERIGRWTRHTHWKDSITRPNQVASKATSQEAKAAAARAHALMSGHQHADYVLFGGGEFPIVECLRLLKDGGYDGWYCYEWEKMWHPDIEDPEIALPPFPRKIRELKSLVDAT